MRRRDFITLVGGTAGWPLAARAQQGGAPVIGLLQIGGPTSWDLAPFRQGLKDAGYVEGQNLTIEYRFANDDASRLPELAADLVQRKVRVIANVGSGIATRAAKDATDTIPIVFGYGIDPVKQGIVASLNRPGGNATGIISLANELYGKQLGILHEVLPQAVHFGVLVNPRGAIREVVLRDTKNAAAAIGVNVDPLDAGTSDEINETFMHFGWDKSIDAMLVSNDAFYVAQHVQLAILAARYSVPTIYPFPIMSKAGGLLSYGPDLAERDRQAGIYVGRILKGENPADLPVQQISKFQLVINLETAKAIGVTIPPSVLARADEVIG
jgi:putative tryptophan/tyrosine transport system substrate-binding protein